MAAGSGLSRHPQPEHPRMMFANMPAITFPGSNASQNTVPKHKTFFFILFFGMAFFFFCVSGGSLAEGGALSRRTHHPLRDLGYFVKKTTSFVCLVGHWLGGGVVKENAPSREGSDVFC